MKTIKLLFIGLAVLSLGLFTSCEEDGEATAPTIEFVAGEGFITANATVTVDVPFTFKWNVSKGSADLESFTIRLGALDIEGYPKTDIDPDFYQGQQAWTITTTGTSTFTFIATDEDGLTDTKTITITAVAAAGPIDSYVDKILGSYDATEGSSFASVDGSVMTSTQASANSDAVDFVYYYGASTSATLAAPSNAAVQTVYTGISGWAVKNATLLGTTTMTATAFDAVDDDTEIVIAATGLTASNATTLEVGDVIAFETAATSENASKKGLLKVVAVTGTGGTGTITIAVKVQQ